MAAKVINFHSPDGKNTYELTFTRDSVEATERAGFPDWPVHSDDQSAVQLPCPVLRRFYRTEQGHQAQGRRRDVPAHRG